LIFARLFLLIGSVADRVKAPFLWRPCDHNRVFNSHPHRTRYCFLV